MNLSFRKVLFIALSATMLVSAGCKKKPRIDPKSTVLGQSGTGGINPDSLGDFNSQAPGTDLTARSGVIEDENTIRGLLQPVYFSFNQSAIEAGERPKLQAAAAYLQANPQYRILLEGRCDWRGTQEYNLGLGDRRAAAAQKYLETLGVGSDKLELLSKGDLEAVENADDATMGQDRRVEIVVLKK